MSEIKDSFIYNFYDYMKAIYIYSHVKTNLKDKQRQKIEDATNIILIIFTSFFAIISAFKILVIIFYFIFIQAFTAFIKFIKTLFKMKFNINFGSTCKNAMYYIGKVCRRIYTFNFYLFDNLTIGIIMTFSYYFFLIISFIFYITNHKYLEDVEKPETYMYLFYLHFESMILIQILSSSFYACRDMKASTLLSIGLFLSINGMIFVGYFITDKIENVDGSFEYDEPQSIMNVIINALLFSINGISLFKVSIHNKNCKFFYNNI